MNRQGWAVVFGCLLIAVLSSGCACVDSCCMDSCDFGGCGCSDLCGSQSQPVVDGLNQMSMEWQNRGGCGGQCGGGCGLLSCNKWGRREHFVDGCGRPCYGPIASIAMTLRNSLMGCGCGELYVDEWLSDPPLCNDPCGTGCSACGECGPYVGPVGGCLGLGRASCVGCSAGEPGCGISMVAEPSCGCVLDMGAEPTCGLAAEPACGIAEPSCGCLAVEPACGIAEPSCGCLAVEPDCGIAEPSCGCLAIEPDCGIASTLAGKKSCGCGGGGGCKVGCGRVAKGLLAGTATKVGCGVETFLAKRKYKWSQRGRAKTCDCRDCDRYHGDIADYRFDTPGQVSEPVAVAAPDCQCKDCKSKASFSARSEAQRVAQLKRAAGRVRQVDYTEAIDSDIR